MMIVTGTAEHNREISAGTRKTPLWLWCLGLLINYLFIAVAYMDFYWPNILHTREITAPRDFILMGFFCSQVTMGLVIAQSDLGKSKKIALAIVSILVALFIDFLSLIPILEQIIGV